MPGLGMKAVAASAAARRRKHAADGGSERLVRYRGGCLEDMVRPSNKQALLAVRRDPAIMVRFWSRVERPDDENACWEWRGCCSKDGHPAFHIGQSSISPSRLAWLWSAGEFPLGGRIHRRCQNPLCLRPAHLLWIVGATMEHRLSAESDGYVPVGGVKVVVDDPPGGWPRTVRITGTPSEAESAPELPRALLRRRVKLSQRFVSSA
jgi:hypothetical protein